MSHDHVVLSHKGLCPEQGGSVRISITLRELDNADRIRLRREHRKRDYTPPHYQKEGYLCPYAASGACKTAADNPQECPVYQGFRYYAYVG